MSQAMSKKHALAVLHTTKSFLYQSPSYTTEENSAFRQEVLKAFDVLAQAIHGKPDGYSMPLCDRCHLHYGPHWIEYRKEGRDYTLHMSVCPSCLEEMKTRLLLVSIDDEPYQPDEQAPQDPLSDACAEQRRGQFLIDQFKALNGITRIAIATELLEG